MMAKPMKTLELHYTLIQFLIINDVHTFSPMTVPVKGFIPVTKTDLSTEVPNSTPPRFVYSEVVCLPTVGILKNCSFLFILSIRLLI